MGLEEEERRVDNGVRRIGEWVKRKRRMGLEEKMRWARGRGHMVWKERKVGLGKGESGVRKREEMD